MDTKILLASYGGGHINIIAAMHNEFKNRGYEPIVLGFTTSEKKLRDLNIPYLSYKDLISLCDNISEIKSFGEQLFAQNTGNNIVSKEESVAYLGINFQELKIKYGIEKAKEMYSNNGRYIFSPENFAEKVITHFKPDIFITTNSPRSEEALIKASMKYNINTYCINDFYNKNDFKNRLGNPNYCTKMFVINEAIKNKLVELGWSSNEVIASGNPALDSINNEINLTLAKKYRNLYLNDNINIFVALSMGDELRSYDLDLLNYLNKLKSIHKFNIIIRKHPNDTRSLPDEDKYILSKNNESVHGWLHTSDIVITCISTVGIEASSINRPVLQYLPKDFSNWLSFEELGIGLTSVNQEEFETKLSFLLKEDKSLVPSNDKHQSAKIIADEILKELYS